MMVRRAARGKGVERRVRYAPLLAAVCILLAVQAWATPQSHRPLSEQDVIGLLTNDVAPARVEALAKQLGVAFQVTAEAEQHLRDAGATDELIQTLKTLAPKAPAPQPAAHPAAPSTKPPPATPSPASARPVLIIVSNPGHAQVYVDDVPVGTTSGEGRLKLINLARGSHHLRISLSGYRDYEQDVELTSGTFSVLAQLERPEPPPTPPASPAPATRSSTPSSAPANPAATPGLLGVFLGARSGGTEGMLVRALVPGGPAEAAGLRPGAIVNSIAGRQLRSIGDIKPALAGRPAGSVVVVQWSDGAGQHNSDITLGSQSIYSQVPQFWVEHDHGPPAPNFCIGWMVVFDGMVAYTGKRAVGGSQQTHSFEFYFSQIKEIKRNAFYMAALGAFHIRTRDGKVANFVVLNNQGQVQPPNQLIATVEQAMARF